MALDAELVLVGERQGLITGTGPGRSADRVFSVNHQIVAPRMPVTGLPTGKRHHKLLTLRKDVSASSVGILQAFIEMENLTEVRLQFFQANALGVARQHFTIQLFNAQIAGVRTVLPDTRSRSKGVLMLNLQEEVSFTYLRIQWTWNDPQRVAVDDWMIAR